MESWIDLKGYEGVYLVSSLGRIKSVDRTIKIGRSFRKRKGRIIKDRGNNYKYVNLSKNGIVKTRLVHRLVLESFYPLTDNKPHVNHKNGLKGDNRLINLESCSMSENMKHASKNGLLISGEDHNRAKLSSQDVKDIRALDFNKVTKKEVAKRYNVSKVTIHRVLSYKSWIYN